MQAFINFIIENKVAIIMILFLVSEALSYIPGIAANGVFQAIVNAIKWLKEKFVPAKA